MEEEARQLEALRQDIASPIKVEPMSPVKESVGVVAEDLQEPEDVDASDVDEYSDEQVVAVSKRISEGSRVVRRRPEADSTEFSLFARLVMVLLIMASGAMLYQYKKESSEIGFCNAGMTTNAILEGRQALTAAVESCQRENRTTLYASEVESVASPVPTGTAAAVAQGSQSEAESAVELCPPPTLDLLPHPQACTPCPQYATCTPSSITCAKGYVLRPHAFLSSARVPHHPNLEDPSLMTFTRPKDTLSAEDWSEAAYSLVSSVFDGLPGFGPVAFPPRCIVDPLARRKITLIGKSIESQLATERGMRLCTGKNADLPETTELEQAKKWGTEVERLSKEIRKKTSVSIFSFASIVRDAHPCAAQPDPTIRRNIQGRPQRLARARCSHRGRRHKVRAS